MRSSRSPPRDDPRLSPHCSAFGSFLWRGLRSRFIPGMAGATGMVDLFELFCEACGVVSGSQCSEFCCRLRIIGRGPIKVGAICPDCTERLRICRRLTLAGAGRKHLWKLLCPLCEGECWIGLGLRLATRLHGVSHRVERDGRHIQTRLPRSDDINTGYATFFLW